MNRTVYVSGAGGYVGRALVPRFKRASYRIIGLTRGDAYSDCDATIKGDLAETIPDLSEADHDSIFVHLAAKAHDRSANADDFFRDTVQCARNVAKAVAGSKIRLVLHISSIGARLAAENSPDARIYGEAKLAAEHVFYEELRSAKGCVLITLRPPAIYGPQAPGSFAALKTAIGMGMPLPFGCAYAERDYLSIDNLVDLLILICDASDKTLANMHAIAFEPCDGEAISTRCLVREIASRLGKPARLMPIPLGALRLAGRLTGKLEMVNGAISPQRAREHPSLREILGWSPAASLADGLDRMCSQR